MSWIAWLWLGSFLMLTIGAALCYRSTTKQGRQYEFGYGLLFVGSIVAFVTLVLVAFP